MVYISCSSLKLTNADVGCFCFRISGIRMHSRGERLLSPPEHPAWCLRWASSQRLHLHSVGLYNYTRGNRRGDCRGDDRPAYTAYYASDYQTRPNGLCRTLKLTLILVRSSLPDSPLSDRPIVRCTIGCNRLRNRNYGCS